MTPIVRGPAQAGRVQITDIYYDGLVPRVESDEYAVMTNKGGTAVNLRGWKLNAGAPDQDFIFPDFTLQPGRSCRVYTNEIRPDSFEGSFGSPQPVWNNKGDSEYLYDEQGARLPEFCY